MKWIVCLVAVFVTSPVASAAAQVILDVGGHGGMACLNGGPGCTGSFLGPYVSFEWQNRVALRVRYFSVDIDDWTSTFAGITIRRLDRSGRFILGEVLYEFRPERRVQPFVGLSAGQRLFRQFTTCEPISCAEASGQPGGPRPVGGAGRDAIGTLGGLVGVTYRPVKQLSIQWLIGVHDPWREHKETVESTLLVGWSLWRSK
jgi:hypothetical protein